MQKSQHVPEQAPPTVDSSDANGVEYCDIFVVGGGINGAGIARDAAGRGYKVALCDADDFALARRQLQQS